MDPPTIIPPPGSENQLPSLLSLKVTPPEELEEGNTTTEVVLPQALEEVLALKTQRALELGTETVPNVVDQQIEAEKESSLAKEDNVVIKLMNYFSP